MFLRDSSSCTETRLKRSGAEAGKAVKTLQVMWDDESLGGIVEAEI